MSTLDSKVVQPTGNFHGQIVIHFLSVAKHILNNATPFDAINDMFNDNTDAGNKRIVLFLLRSSFFPFGLFLGLKSDDPFWLIPLKPCIFIEGDMVWKSGLFFIHNLFVMTFAFISWAQVIDFARMDATNNEILDRVRFFLPL